MKDYKDHYNALLARYNKGILYLEQNPNMIPKWSPEIEKIMEDLDTLIKTYKIPDEKILGGF